MERHLRSPIAASGGQSHGQRQLPWRLRCRSLLRSRGRDLKSVRMGVFLISRLLACHCRTFIQAAGACKAAARRVCQEELSKASSSSSRALAHGLTAAAAATLRPADPPEAQAAEVCTTVCAEVFEQVLAQLPLNISADDIMKVLSSPLQLQVQALVDSNSVQAPGGVRCPEAPAAATKDTGEVSLSESEESAVTQRTRSEVTQNTIYPPLLPVDNRAELTTPPKARAQVCQGVFAS